jgi:hypothetical protein
MKIFLPYLRKQPGPPCGQRDPYSGKRTDSTWKRSRFDKAVAAAVRKAGQRQDTGSDYASIVATKRHYAHFERRFTGGKPGKI